MDNEVTESKGLQREKVKARKSISEGTKEAPKSNDNSVDVQNASFHKKRNKTHTD